MYLGLKEAKDVWGLQASLNDRILVDRQLESGLGFDDIRDNPILAKKWILNFSRAAIHEYIELDEAILEKDTQNILVEMVDILHFIVSIAQTVYARDEYETDWMARLFGVQPTLDNTCRKKLPPQRYPLLFGEVLEGIRTLCVVEEELHFKWWSRKTVDDTKVMHAIERVFRHYWSLADMLGIEHMSIYKAYIAKNAINHKRQDNNYNEDTKTETDNRCIVQD